MCPGSGVGLSLARSWSWLPQDVLSSLVAARALTGVGRCVSPARRTLLVRGDYYSRETWKPAIAAVGLAAAMAVHESDFARPPLAGHRARRGAA